jgi:preprotein translocase subunit SecB
LRPDDPFLAVAQLRHAWLSAVDFVERDKFVPSADWEFFVKFEHEIVSADDEAAGVRLNVMITWERKAAEAEQTAAEAEQTAADAEPPFELELSVDGMFEWERPGIDEDFRRSWLEFNAAYLLWPYARNFAATITSSSSLPVLTMPTLRVPHPPLASLMLPGLPEGIISQGEFVAASGAQPELEPPPDEDQPDPPGSS